MGPPSKSAEQKSSARKALQIVSQFPGPKGIPSTSFWNGTGVLGLGDRLSLQRIGEEMECKKETGWIFSNSNSVMFNFIC